VLAVEHDPLWQRKTVQALQEKALDGNVEVRLANEEEYVAQIDTFADHTIDFILVDGIRAGEALAVAMRKLKHGGMLVVNGAHLVLPSDSTTPDARSREDGPDDALDPAELIELMRWRLKWESDGVNDTAVFWKP
jgi:predicted O-methyltransferase YrrM